MTNARNVEGVALRLNEKQVNTKNGIMTTYSVLMQEGNDENWYGFAFKKPPIVPNQQVKFIANPRSWVNQEGMEQTFWDGDGNSITTIKTADAAAPAVMKKAVKNVDNRQRSIVLQTAFKIAPSMVGYAIDNNFVTMPTKKADKFDAYKELVVDTALELAARFIDPPLDFTKEEQEVAVNVSSNGEYVDAASVV